MWLPVAYWCQKEVLKICLKCQTENLPHPTYLWRVSCSTRERWFNKKETNWLSTTNLIVSNNYINNNNNTNNKKNYNDNYNGDSDDNL